MSPKWNPARPELQAENKPMLGVFDFTPSCFFDCLCQAHDNSRFSVQPSGNAAFRPA